MFKIRKGSKNLVFFVVLFVALPPFAIDTYIPAFGNIANSFNVPVSSIAITISTYLVGFGLGMFFWGALSDRYGRKKILIIGMLVYIASTILCSQTDSFNTLIFMRFIQGLGDSPAAVAAMAILKDCYRGQKLIKTVATMIMVFMIAPIVAPIVGSVIIYTTGKWQNIFHFLTFYGIVLLFITFMMPETLKPHKRPESLVKSFAVYIKHLLNGPFMLGTITGALVFGAMFSFISASSTLIIEYYHLGYTQFCAIFALNILGLVFASNLIRKKLTPHNRIRFISLGYALAIVVVFINVILSYTIDNIYVFVVFNTFATAGFALTNITISSKTIDILKEGFGAGNAIMRLFKFIVAGFAGFSLSFISISHLMIGIPIQQLIFVLLSAGLFLIIKDKLFLSN
ncbi:MAG: DHA1 family bicyclomycin/chloramphenicol resistance-like MFS transporter [Francisella sp.]|jgi:DHA1 family bicyclomycin/chloramphenicol resistance-like MFS transporter